MTVKNERELIDKNLIQATVRLNMMLFAFSGFIFGGFSLMLVTLFSKPDPEHILNILILFLPGYSISTGGAWVGLFWGGIIGAAGSAFCYKIYSRNIFEYVKEFLESGRQIEELEHAHVMLNGKKLGLIIGLLTAVSLFLTSNYLVFIGHEPGKHIDLLSKWLPHYELSVSGGILGAFELFMVVFIFCYVVGSIYNKIMLSRSGTAL